VVSDEYGVASFVTAPSWRRAWRCFDFRLTVRAAMSPAEVTEKLGLHKMRERSWYVHPR
jgi:hypothetical protein